MPKSTGGPKPRVPLVLVVDDQKEERESVAALLRVLGCRVETVEDGVTALRRLERSPVPDVVLLDILMPRLDGLETLRRYRASGGAAAMVIGSAMGSRDAIVRAMKEGAEDYLVKPYNPSELAETIERLVRGAVLEKPDKVPLTACEFITASDAMKRVLLHVDTVASTDVPVLITGESGVGKDLLARAIHNRSRRSAGPYLKINCASLPSELLESELFGYEKGAFTGANRSNPGKLEAANSGTVFLDEIGEMSPELQAKLLQVLQDNEFYRVGGNQKVRLDVRVVVATNKNLEAAIKDGSFREDLFFRLNVVWLKVPPLRKRKEDIPLLAEYFLKKYSTRYDRHVGAIPEDMLLRLMEYDWPGNVRELESTIRRYVVFGDAQAALEGLRGKEGEASSTGGGGDAVRQPATISLKEIGRRAAREAENRAIAEVLRKTRGNKREAARILQISYKALLYKIKDSNIDFLDDRWRMPHES